MPTIFEARCTCGFSRRVTRCSAVIVDRPEQAQVPWEGDRLLAILPHPCEERAMLVTGYSYASASREGRLVLLHTVSCKDCGELFEKKSLIDSTGALGCLVPLAVGVGAGGLIAHASQSACAGAVAAIVACVGLTWTVDFCTGRLIRRRHAERIGQFASQACPKCGCARAVELDREVKHLKCPQCSAASLEVHCVGIS